MRVNIHISSFSNILFVFMELLDGSNTATMRKLKRNFKCNRLAKSLVNTAEENECFLRFPSIFS